MGVLLELISKLIETEFIKAYWTMCTFSKILWKIKLCKEIERKF
jgi:hypothetical protein